MGKGERLTAVLTGGPPWGFRLSGGLEVKQPLKVAKVRKKSKAHGSGLQEGDEVLAVNGAPCQDVTHKDCMGIVEGATDRLELEVLRKRPTYNVQPAGQTTEQEESGSKLEIKVNSVAKKDKQHVSTLQIKPVTVSASAVKSESRREVSAITVAKEESSRQSQVVRSTESEYSTLERKSKNVSKVNGLGQVSVFSGSARSEEEESEERKVQGFSYLKPGDIRSLGQSGPQEEKQKRAPPTAVRPSQEEFPANPPPSYSRALAEPQYQQLYSPTSGQPGGQPFEEEEPPSSAFRSVRPPGQQGQGINSQSGPLPRQQQQIQEPQAVTSTQPAVQRPTPIRQQPAAVYQPERPAGSPHTWSAGVPKQEPVPAPQPATQQPAGSYPFDQPAPYSQPPASAPTHTWNPTGRSKPKTPITPTTPIEVSPNKVFSVFDAGATWEPPKEDEREAGNMMNAKPKAPMFKVKKFDFKPQTWAEGSSSGRPMTQEDLQTMDLPLGPMGQYRNKQREMLAYEKSGAVWSPSGTTSVSGPKSWSPGGGDVQERPHEVREQPWSPTGRPQAPQQQSPQPAPAVWSPSGGGGQAPRAAQPVSFHPGGGAGDHGPQPTSNGVWRPSQMPPSSQGYYSGERDSGIWSPTGTHATASSRSFNDTDGHHSPASFDPRPKMVSAQSSSARSAAASLKKPGDITPAPTGDNQPGPALVATGPVVMNGTVHVNLEWQNEPESCGYGVRTPATITLEEPLKVSDEEDLYPPEERYKVKICHRLARALLSRRNRFSRGGRMFWKRRLRAHKWEADPFGPAVHPRDATPQEFRPGVDVPDVPDDLYQLVLEEIREGPADDDVDETDFDYPYNSPGAPGRGGKAVGPTRVGPLPSYLNIQEEQTRNASEHFMTVKPTPALTSSKDTSKPILQTLPTRSYLEIQKEAKPEPENAADKEKKQKQRLHPKSISEYYNLPPEAALPEKDTIKRIPVSEIEPINFNVDLEDKSRCTHQTPEMLSHDAARRLAEATFFEEGKGANMFMKRMERMSKYVIDESNVKKAPPKPQVSPNVPQYQYQKQQQQATPTVQEMKDMMSQVTYRRPPKSPWEAAIEGSGKIDDAFSHIRGDKLLLDVPAGSQTEYDPFDPTLPFPGPQPTDLGGEGAPSWASQDGMIEKPTSPSGPQFKDFNLKPRGWVSSGGGYFSDQLATDYESDTNLSTASAPTRPLFKVSKVPTAAGTARELRPQHLYYAQPPQQRSMSPVRPLTPQRPATPPYWQSSRSSTPPYWQRKATPPDLPRAQRSQSRSPGPGMPSTSSWRHTIPRSEGKPKPKSPTKAPTPFTVASFHPPPSPRPASPVDVSWRRSMSLTTPDYGMTPEKSPTHFTQANFLHSRQHVPMEKLGKGAKMFQKQKERSEKFIIDENTVARTPIRRAERERSSSSSSSSHASRARLTPWEAAATMGTVDPAFSGIDMEMKVHGSPYKARVAHAVMDAAGSRAMPSPPEEWKRTQMNGQQWSPTVASYVTKPRFNARQMSMSPTVQPARVTPFAFTYNPSIKAWSPQHSAHESEE